MNKEWSEKNRKMQSLIGKKESFDEGIALLLELTEGHLHTADEKHDRVCERKQIMPNRFNGKR